MTPAMRTTETLLLNGKIQHDNHPVLKMCMANARVDGPEHNRKLDKMKSTGRIDGAVALVMALSVAAEEYKVIVGPSVYETRGALSL